MMALWFGLSSKELKIRFTHQMIDTFTKTWVNLPLPERTGKSTFFRDFDNYFNHSNLFFRQTVEQKAIHAQMDQTKYK